MITQLQELEFLEDIPSWYGLRISVACLLDCYVSFLFLLFLFPFSVLTSSTHRISSSFVFITNLIIPHEKITRFWLATEQCKLHIVILDYDWQKDNEKFCRSMTSYKAMTKILYGNSEKRFFECEKKWFQARNIWHYFPSNFFHVFIINK